MGICSSCDTQPHCHNLHQESTHCNSQEQKCFGATNERHYYSHAVPKLNNWYNEIRSSTLPSQPQTYKSYPEEYYQPPRANNTVKHITVASSPTNYYYAQ